MLQAEIDEKRSLGWRLGHAELADLSGLRRKLDETLNKISYGSVRCLISDLSQSSTPIVKP